MKSDEFENMNKALKEPILQFLWRVEVGRTTRFGCAFPQFLNVGELQFVRRASQEPSNIQQLFIPD